MRKAPHLGLVTIDVPGVGSVDLRYDWAAIAKLHGAYGKEWEGELVRIAKEADARGLAELLAIGSEYDADWWVDQSPPFVFAARAVQTALNLAFFGVEEPGQKHPQTARRSTIQSSKAGKSGSSSAGQYANSGA